MDLPSQDLGKYQNSLNHLATAILAPLFALASISALGIGSFSIEGFSLGSIFFSWSGLTVTWASVLAFMAVVVAYFQNDRDLHDFQDKQSYVAYATAFSVIILGIAPTLRDAIAGSSAASWLIFILQLIGYGAIAELGNTGGVKQ